MVLIICYTWFIDEVEKAKACQEVTEALRYLLWVQKALQSAL